MDRHVINVRWVEKRNFTTVAVGSSFTISLSLYRSIQSVITEKLQLPVMGLILHVSMVCVCVLESLRFCGVRKKTLTC